MDQILTIRENVEWVYEKTVTQVGNSGKLMLSRNILKRESML